MRILAIGAPKKKKGETVAPLWEFSGINEVRRSCAGASCGFSPLHTHTHTQFNDHTNLNTNTHLYINVSVLAVMRAE